MPDPYPVNQKMRDRRAIKMVLLGHTEPVSFSQILLQAGEGLRDAFVSMIGDGTVAQQGLDDHGRRLWKLVR